MGLLHEARENHVKKKVEEALRSKMKHKALKECDLLTAKYAECASGRTLSVVWKCRQQAKELNTCLHQLLQGGYSDFESIATSAMTTEETEGYGDELNVVYTPVKAIALPHDDDSKQLRGRDISRKRRKENRIDLLLTRPPYTLTVGNVNVRKENRDRLSVLLNKLVLRRNWTDASGVLSVLLKATCRERTPYSPEHALRSDRNKYSVAMEICRHMESDQKAYSMKIEDLYRRWILKVRSLKNKPSNDKCILLDHILSSFARNEHSISHDALKSLKQTVEYGRDPMTYLVIGLASYEVWYSGIQKEIRQRNLENPRESMLSETVAISSSGFLNDMMLEDADSIDESCSAVDYNSEASVFNDNNAPTDSKQNSYRESRCNINVEAERHQQFQTQYFSGNTIDTLDEIDETEHHDQFDSFNDFNYHGVESFLPLKMPLPENVACSYKDYYNDAVNYLKLALQSPPPVSEASLGPLVQLLLLGGQVNEAFLMLCYESNSVLPGRLRARLQECVKPQDFYKLSSSFEDVLKTDPTCRRSLTKLIEMHRRGEYDTDCLVEMISLHLEATRGDQRIWKEFANCLLKISPSDNVSMCMDGEKAENEERRTMRFSTTPVLFLEGDSGENWKIRCKWWLNGGSGHFCRRVLTSEIEKGEFELIVYKAACASHLYGKDLEYVVKAHACENKYDNTLSKFLRSHMEEAIGVFSGHVMKTRYGQMTIA